MPGALDALFVIFFHVEEFEFKFIFLGHKVLSLLCGSIFCYILLNSLLFHALLCYFCNICSRCCRDIKCGIDSA